MYGGWVQRMLEAGQLRQVDESPIALTPSSVPRLVLKTWAAWFH